MWVHEQSKQGRSLRTARNNTSTNKNNTTRATTSRRRLKRSKQRDEFDGIDKKIGPIFYMSSKGIFPINETLLPMFKRRIAGHISQTKKFEELKENNG